jgi:quercetin dioxygenase-like cupin family protein
MIVARNDKSRAAKGWYNELSHPSLPAVGFANQGINEPHYHRQLYEVYLVARGSSVMVVDDTSIALQAGDVVVVEPGQVHTFVENTPDYFHFVLHCPPIRGDKVVGAILQDGQDKQDFQNSRD